MSIYPYAFSCYATGKSQQVHTTATMPVNLPFLDQGVGYGLIVGFGAFFAVSMTSLSILLARYKSQIQTSEMLMTANHSLKVGLIASAVVSSWTLAATLLSSTTGIHLHTNFIVPFSNSKLQKHINGAYPDRSGMAQVLLYRYSSSQLLPLNSSARLHGPIHSWRLCALDMVMRAI